MLLMLSGAVSSVCAYGQSNVVTGKVTGAGEPIIGAGVIEKGTTNGAVTDIDGKFSLAVGPNAVLVVSYVGFQTQEVAINGRNNLEIILEEDNQVLEETIVVGYGVQKKKVVTGATVQVKGEDVAKLSTTNVLEAMQSQTPGVNITSNNGQPGAGFKVNIRGMGTVGNSEPLYVIDGMAGGDINTLNPSDIQSIDVLKDAASAAIYGSRAANGVILVTTKQGKQGKTQVTFDGYVGWQDVYKMPKMLTAKQAMAIEDENSFRSNVPTRDWQALLGPRVYGMIQDGWKGTNWLEQIRTKHASTQNYAIGMNGGNEVSRYAAGFSYTGQDGIFGKPKASKYDRYTFRINSDHTIIKGKDFDILKIGENVNFYYSRQNGISQTMQGYNDIETALNTTPLMPLYNAAGDGYFSQDDKVAEGWNYSNELFNPLLKIANQTGTNRQRNYGLTAQAYVDLQPIKNLRYHGAFSFRYTNQTYRNLTVPYNASTVQTSDSYSVLQEQNSGHKISVENTISYKLPQLGCHSLDILVGQSFEKTSVGDYMRAANSVPDGSQLPTMLPDMSHAWLDNVSNVLASTVLKGYPWPDWSILSYFGRINYSFDEKYLLTAIIRADASSNFARGNRWGYFPSVSAGWVLSSEKFMQNTRHWLDLLKIRASWGQNGNQDIANFQYLSPVAFDQSHVYNFGPTVLNTTGLKSTGAYATTLANKDITWEKSEQLNIGLDAYFFASRLQFNFDWYKKTTKDWLVQAPVLDTAGTNPPYINGGDVENTGVEFALSWKDNAAKDFTYGAGVNFSYNHNEVTRVANADGIIHGDLRALNKNTNECYRAEVGQPIGYFWGFKTDGVFQNQAEINEWTAAGNGLYSTDTRPGDIRVIDMNHDGKIDASDKTKIGNPNPKFRLGFNLNFGYKGLDLAATCTGAFGHKILFAYRNSTNYALQRWHGEGTTNRVYTTIGEDISDTQLERANFLRLQNVTLGYDFKKLFPSMPLQQLRLYVSGQNLYTFTGYHGMDPEVGYGGTDEQGNQTRWMSGIDLGSYPVARTILIGLNIKF